HGLDGKRERPRDSTDLGRQAPQDAAHFTLFFALEDDAFGAEPRHLRRFDENRFPGTAGPMNHARDLVAEVDRDRKNVMVAADGRIWIAKDFAQLGIAQQVLDLDLYTLVEVGDFLPDLGQLRTGHVEDV